MYVNTARTTIAPALANCRFCTFFAAGRNFILGTSGPPNKLSTNDGIVTSGIASFGISVEEVIFPAALPGIVGSILLAVSRAVGETMIVVMASGLAANLTMNPLESTSTITAQIVVILIGDQQFGDPKTQSAFALGISLFIVTLFLNVIALSVVKKYREKYE